MGHRHLFSPSYMLEAENDQSWNLTEHPYIHNTRNVSSETTSIIYPDNMSIDGGQYTHCNHTSYSSLPNNLQIPDYQQNSAGPSDLPMHTPYINIPPGDYRNQASSSSSSSNYNGNPFNEDLFDIRMGSNNNNNNNNSNNNNNNSNTRGHGHGHYKRKSPGVPDVATTNGTSSADVTMLTEQQQQQQPWQEPPSINFLHAPWDYNNNTTTPDHHHHHHNHHHHHHHHHHHRSNSSLLIGESSRNVRSRGMFDLEANSSRTQLTNNLSRDYFTTSRPMDVSPSLDLNAWNPTTHDSNSLNCEMNPFLEGNSNPSSSSLEIGQQQQQQNNNNLVTRNNHVLQNFHATSLQSVRGVRSNYGQSQSQRLGSTFRVSSTSSNHLRLGHTDEGLQLATNNYSSRNLRPSSSNSLGWHSNSDRSGRVRLSNERYRSFSGVNFHDRQQPEGLVIVDRSAFYGSRNPFDQHRDMRLDIDDMSYEELLALGERIGSVATGLPDPLISKSIQESIYCSSDQIQDEATCVICLEEYANMDDIGMLKACGHDFHVGCIKKWLSMKNMCPICKTEPAKQK